LLRLPLPPLSYRFSVVDSTAPASASAAAAPAAKKTNLLPLSVLQAAVSINDLKMDGDELECIIANLIFQGYIKGYIAHKRCIVLSKTDPFPSSAMSNLG
jgi:hypothetical protein